MVRQTLKLQKMDPWILPNKEFNINKKVMMMPFKSHIKVFEGVLTGLSNIVRTGVCFIRADEQGLRLALDLGISNVRLHYKGTMTFRGQMHRIVINARVKKARAILNIGPKNPRQLHVQKFKMENLRGFKVDIHEVGEAKSSMFTTLLKTTRMYIERYVKRKLEPTITEELNKRLQQGQQYLGGAKG
ncbi:hypothetical protein HPB47_019341 [Ixodes persulcatus]|uniref:Uncharacterized protein n=1 Tax=Ixodes persulcatus TaxID=34615 RepID=A0AC60QKA9_IXOPE|nr:hypothetical protein HPB47_019341 [Ixodes persulcatus]